MFFDIKNLEVAERGDYFVDTNVWYWITYVASKSFLAVRPQEYQLDHYPSFIEMALNSGSTLYYSPLTLVELASLIERSEWEIFKQFNSAGNCNLKSFRRDDAQRRGVIAELKTAWDAVTGMARPLPYIESGEMASNIMGILESALLDGYDAIYVWIMRECGVLNVISDDKDFKGVKGLNLYGCYKPR